MRASLLALFLLGACAGNSHPLGPWAPINSSVRGLFVNTSDTKVLVSVTAPRLGMSRTLGLVAPHDSALYVVPFAETKVDVLVDGTRKTTFEPRRPGTWRFVIP